VFMEEAADLVAECLVLGAITQVHGGERSQGPGPHLTGRQPEVCVVLTWDGAGQDRLLGTGIICSAASALPGLWANSA